MAPADLVPFYCPSVDSAKRTCFVLITATVQRRTQVTVPWLVRIKADFKGITCLVEAKLAAITDDQWIVVGRLAGTTNLTG